ncbi:pilus assembly protein TadG-related protein [Sandaracinobacteroides hominis]|uniref:pilus assembly protein TadG-related protein n=1 Tax=Sandaracinobacteroides hominis TaxID=2780086 RepID=UPI0018F3ED8A|nr:pilus assembly protein TadG-related protein [Sandaracinobacteroides hominis]
MANIKNRVKRLLRDNRGAVAFTFALMVPVFIGAGALAVDMANYRYVDNRLQTAADAAALAAVKALDTPNIAKSDAVSFAARNVPANFGTVTTTSDVTIGIYDPETRVFTPSNSADVNAVRVISARTEARNNVTPQILSVIWGKDNVEITKVAIAARQLKVQYEPPERVNLANEAYDFNEIYAYCYKYEGSGSQASRRSQMTLVSNNMASGQSIVKISKGVIKQDPPGDKLVWPECKEDESLSFRLHNVRDAKNNPALWNNPSKLSQYDHYTDTHITKGVETFELTNNILETVRCDTLDKCDPSKPGATVPKGKNRTPMVEKTPCLPGKYMYFGWEDRPPSGPGGSDKDYDDIVMVMKCPRTGILGDGMTRLVA